MTAATTDGHFILNNLSYIRVTERGDIRVQYDGCNNRWTFHPGALTKVDVFEVGDIVFVLTDINAVKDLQRGGGSCVGRV